ISTGRPWPCVRPGSNSRQLLRTLRPTCGRPGGTRGRSFWLIQAVRDLPASDPGADLDIAGAIGQLACRSPPPAGAGTFARVRPRYSRDGGELGAGAGQAALREAVR